MQRRLLLDVVVSKRAAVLQLLAREDEALLVGRDALLVLDLRLRPVSWWWVTCAHTVSRAQSAHVRRVCVIAQSAWQPVAP